MRSKNEFLLVSGFVFWCPVLMFPCDCYGNEVGVVLLIRTFIRRRSFEAQHSLKSCVFVIRHHKNPENFWMQPETRMNCFLIYAFLFLFFIFEKCQTDTRSCGYPPSQWCSSLEIAVECGVSCKLLNIPLWECIVFLLYLLLL